MIAKPSLQTGFSRFLDWFRCLDADVSRVIEAMPTIADAIQRSTRQCWRYLATAVEYGFLEKESRFDMTKPIGNRAQWANEYIIRPTPEQKQRTERRRASAKAYRVVARARSMRLWTTTIPALIDLDQPAILVNALKNIANEKVARFRKEMKSEENVQTVTTVQTVEPPRDMFVTPEPSTSIFHSGPSGLRGFYERQQARRTQKKMPGG